MEVQYLQIVHTSEVTLKKVEVFKKFPTSLSVAPKEPEFFFQRLRGTSCL